MVVHARTRFGIATMVLLIFGLAVSAQETSSASKCKSIHASMVENRSTVGCKPGHPSCFLGEVTGNHGLRGTTYFRSDSFGSRPSTSPDSLPYTGLFEYHLDGGTLTMRETGISNTSQGRLESGAVTAFQLIIDATGELAGATGYLFVSGFNRAGVVETTVSGEICMP